MKWIVGVDEVGRGPLAGPVLICAIAMPADTYKKMKWHRHRYTLTDSKKMSRAAREYWYHEAKRMRKEGKVRYMFARRGASTIDARGIARCVRECVDAALDRLAIAPTHCEVLLDGSLFASKKFLLQKTIIRGDSKKKIISLASVVAKVTRDKTMDRFHFMYPDYGWNENKGYGTKVHMRGIRKTGLSPLHRRTFTRNFIDG
ncbi:MAG TPA: ribonuclease HII [Candidatus Paceibacterota bacterium]|nr:ribonuclease HII [Candidatus Paceibacterota bacterium]